MKAKSLFDDLKSKAAVSNDNASGSKTQNEAFEASNGWFERFKVRTNLHSSLLKAKQLALILLLQLATRQS